MLPLCVDWMVSIRTLSGLSHTIKILWLILYRRKQRKVRSKRPCRVWLGIVSLLLCIPQCVALVDTPIRTRFLLVVT